MTSTSSFMQRLSSDRCSSFNVALRPHAETVRTIRDREPRTSTSSFTQRLSSDRCSSFSVALWPHAETVRTIRDGEPRTSTSSFTQRLSSDLLAASFFFIQRQAWNSWLVWQKVCNATDLCHMECTNFSDVGRQHKQFGRCINCQASKVGVISNDFCKSTGVINVGAISNDFCKSADVMTNSNVGDNDTFVWFQCQVQVLRKAHMLSTPLSKEKCPQHCLDSKSFQ